MSRLIRNRGSSRQPAWRAVLSKTRKHGLSRSVLERTARRHGTDDLGSVIRWLERRRFISGNGVDGWKLTIEGAGALAVTRRRVWRA